MKKSIFFSIFVLFIGHTGHAQLISDPAISDDLMQKSWDASWVKVPESSSYDYGVYFFRNMLELSELPMEYIIHISADNRYKLFVNGQWVGIGPARSDAENWIYETYNLAPYLRAGSNTIAAIVWNFGEYKPRAQVSLFTGLIIQGEGELSSQMNTPGSWTCNRIDAYKPVENNKKELEEYTVVGPGDHVDGNKYPWNWLDSDFDESMWLEPISIYKGNPKEVGREILHALIPREIPAMELKELAPPQIREIDNSPVISDGITINNEVIQANSKRVYLLDQKQLTTAYPQLNLSGGKDAKLTLSYAETLFNRDGKKPHRDLVSGLLFKGRSDLYTADGGSDRTFTTLWYRTFRYIQLEVETSDDPLTINSISSIFSAYPFEEKAYFQSDNQQLNELWDIGWQTTRLCAHEQYSNCPYYEQLQYVGDTRIQALVSLYVSGDDRLMKKAINDFYNSIVPEGLTQSRYPSNTPQIIPTYSLSWISMIHDYLQNRDDYMFAAQYLVSIQHILQWFENRIDDNSGMLGEIEYWPFVDWTKEWKYDNEMGMGGVPPGAKTGNSSIITLHYASTLNEAADIFSFYGLESLSKSYKSRSKKLINASRLYCWNESRGYFADTPGQSSFSQHANTYAMLAGAIPKVDAALFMEKILRDTTLTKGSPYFNFHINKAAIQAGLGNKYLSYLQPWQDMLDQGLTTFSEITDLKNSRSDCYAWSTSPLYELLSTVAGIKPAEVGFGTVIIQPHPGTLKWILASLPHAKGDIKLDLKFNKKGGVNGTITLPVGIEGIFVWDQQTIDIKEGLQKINIKSLDSKYKIK